LETNTVELVVVIVVVILIWILLGYPYWRVWASHQSDLADLQKAKNEWQIQVVQVASVRDSVRDEAMRFKDR